MCRKCMTILTLTTRNPIPIIYKLTLGFDFMVNDFHKNLKNLMDEYAHFVYNLSRTFPREEIYGVTSQLRRATLSVVLNYIEGFARFSEKAKKNFYVTSYASLKESKYLLHFSLVEEYLNKEDYSKALDIANKIGAMLWGIIKNDK